MKGGQEEEKTCTLDGEEESNRSLSYRGTIWLMFIGGKEGRLYEEHTIDSSSVRGSISAM